MKHLMPIFFIVLIVSLMALLSPVWAQEEQLRIPERIFNGPVYPEEMIKKNTMGHVEIVSDINTTGHNINCRVIFSTNSEFNKSALEYCQRARYSPALKGGVPVVERDHHITINFKLK